MSWQDGALRWKISAVAVGVATLALVCFVAADAAFYRLARGDEVQSELSGIVDLLAQSLSLLSPSESPRDAESVLASLEADPRVIQAYLFRPGGELLATYSRAGQPPQPVPGPAAEGTSFSDGQIVFTRTLMRGDEEVGALWLSADLTGRPARRSDAAARRVKTVTVALCVLVALALSFVFGGILARPFANLSRLAERARVTEDYSLRADTMQRDEAGRLAASINGLLGTVETSERRLTKTQALLTEQIQEQREERFELRRMQQRERDLQDRLSRSEKMESLGVLAGGVAHDLNNILGPIVAYPDLLFDSMSQDDPLRDCVRQMKSSALKAAAIIQDLLTLARRGSYRRDLVRLDELLESYFKGPEFIEQQELHPKTRLAFEKVPTISPVRGSEPHLRQVVRNLILNAFEAMGSTGTLGVQVDERSLVEPHKGFETVPPGRYVVLSVSDTGSGIESADVRRIFEPFYTRKEMGRSGSGLGLAVVYGVVKDLEGFIDVVSRPGGGTALSLYLPSAAEAVSHSGGAEVDLRGSESILVVDDEEPQRKLATQVLESFGYTVAVAKGGQEALEYLRLHRPDMVLLDMVMEPDFDGLTTYRHMRRMHPGLPCLIVSGFSENERVREALKLGVGAYVPKPYTREAVARSIRHELDRDQSEPE